LSEPPILESFLPSAARRGGATAPASTAFFDIHAAFP
jgi:hypothetical protein